MKTVPKDSRRRTNSCASSYETSRKPQCMRWLCLPILASPSLKFHAPTSLFLLSFFKLCCMDPKPLVTLSKLLEVQGWLVYVINPAQSFYVQTFLSSMDWGRKEQEGGLLVVAYVGISRQKSIPFHTSEKMDEEVCPSAPPCTPASLSN